jgi:hydrogenase expression/formation protein HypC
MCLGIPGEIVVLRHDIVLMGDVKFGSVLREVCLEYVPEARIGDYVIVHAGFAIAKLDVAEAERSIELIDSAYRKGAESNAPTETD